MERVNRLIPAARLHAVGVIGFVHTVLATPAIPAGSLKVMRPKAKRPMNQAIHATVGYQKPNYRH